MTRDGGPNAVFLNGDDALGNGDRDLARERRGDDIAEDLPRAEAGAMDAQDAWLIVLNVVIMMTTVSNGRKDMLVLESSGNKCFSFCVSKQDLID